jgi:hypothetical protein
VILEPKVMKEQLVLQGQQVQLEQREHPPQQLSKERGW